MIRWLWKIFLRSLRLLFSIGNLGALAAGQRATKRLLDDTEISSLALLEKELSLRYSQLTTQEAKLCALRTESNSPNTIRKDIDQEIRNLVVLRKETSQLLQATWRAKCVVVYRSLLYNTIKRRPRSPSTSVGFIQDFYVAEQEFRSSAVEWTQYLQMLQRQMAKIPSLQPPRQGELVQKIIDEVSAERIWLEESFSQEIRGAKCSVENLKMLAEWCQTKAITTEMRREPVQNPMEVVAELEEFDMLLPTQDQMRKIEDLINDIDEFDRAEQEVEDALRRYIPTRTRSEE